MAWYGLERLGDFLTGMPAEMASNAVRGPAGVTAATTVGGLRQGWDWFTDGPEPTGGQLMSGGASGVAERFANAVVPDNLEDMFSRFMSGLDDVIDDGASALSAARKPKKPITPPRRRAVASGGRTAASAPMSTTTAIAPATDPFEGIGQPPTPQIRSLSELMKDPALGGIANKQISMANAAIGRENMDRRRQLQRDIAAVEGAGSQAEQQLRQVAHSNLKASNALETRHNEEQSRQQRTVDDVIRNVAMNMIADDNVRGQLQASQAMDVQERAGRQALDDDLMKDLAISGQSSLREMQAAQPMQTAADVSAMTASTMGELQSNRRKAADNWLNRSAILSELAAQEQGADQQRSGQALDAYNTRASILDSWRNAQLQREQLSMQERVENAKLALSRDELALGRDQMSSNERVRLAAARANALKARLEARGGGGSGGAATKDLVAVWKLFNTPSGTVQEYVSDNGDKNSFTPQYRDTVDSAILEQWNPMFIANGLPPVFRQQAPQSSED